MNPQLLLIVLAGVLVGIGAAFSGLGGGFLMVPLLLLMGFPAQKAVGTSFLGIFIISVSALAAHGKLANVDWKLGLLLGVGGVVGAQIGARIVEHVSTAQFKRIFATVLLGLAAYLFFKR
ncbi:MAG TPA: sulfite exporter TauE/SafE family protein [Thermoanaerobaculales bacterium]|nr:sulfite exporter TauE/SafE family protein [Thermoanaerobaculales bacterium]HPA82705.1 sulfite exporter TauE/SafE family protein [Thermoanaerobaculales bacterium]HQL31507.1 sulfite exporter TauE/SafE family protein [Thermoanaerobaculales bacterium]HQN96959.1 sulfite exporter TauE/SafE family protein [Thermoanaerobaculales bacterium]HQP44979.1 sulfite exporter TauE/SafE family protein [Thermoanaerobaculales bacterium]